MALSTKELRQRIRGVSNIQKITRAMEMVATTKMRRLQARAEGTRPYADAIRSFGTLLAGAAAKVDSPLTQSRDEIRHVGVLVIAADRGLCGSYNANLLRETRAYLDEAGLWRDAEGPAGELTLLGRKARQHFARRPVAQEVLDDVVEKIEFRRAREISEALSRAFLTGGADGGVDEVWISYTRFISMGRQVPTRERLLPIAPAPASEEIEEAAAAPVDVILEPSAEELYRRLLPKSLAVQVYAAILDALASEYAARRAAMKAATDAAGDMIGELTRRYNRARQESITKELLDIVGGAEALS